MDPLTLVVDVGNTLLTRSGPGAMRRSIEAIRRAGIPVCNADTRRTVADVVHTGADRAAVATRLATRLNLSASSLAGLHRALHQPEGNARILSGATGLLLAARANGWRVIAATDAAAWVPPVPPELTALLTAVVSSSTVGRIKLDRLFWDALIREQHIDPMRCLVVGDSEEADVAAPSRAGLLAILVHRGARTLDWLVSCLSVAGPPPGESLAVVGGEPRPHKAGWTLSSPHLVPLVAEQVSMPVRVRAGITTRQGVVLRRFPGPPELVFDGPAPPPALAWVLPHQP